MATLLPVIAGFLFLSASCGIVSYPESPMIFRSDEYIIYTLQKKDTPVCLAERFLNDKKKSWVIEDANENASFTKGESIVIPLKDKDKAGLAIDGYQTVPILCYHRFAENCKSSLCMPSHIFDRQMKYLKKNGYRVINFKELLEFLEYRKGIPNKSVIISIDDGYRSIYDIAYPILQKYGFKATLFIYTDFINASRNALTWNQLSEMKANGFEIGSHTIYHSDLTRLKEGENLKAYRNRIEKELRGSKLIIDKKLAQNTICIAFPYGRYNQNLLKACERFGYRIGVSVKRGSNPFFADPLTLKRNQILKQDMQSFVFILKTFQNFSLK